MNSELIAPMEWFNQFSPVSIFKVINYFCFSFFEVDGSVLIEQIATATHKSDSCTG